jgi:hypothetical protein
VNQILQPVINRSPTLARVPQDMRPYGLLGGRYDYLAPGHYQFLSDHERENSRADYAEFQYHINDLGFRGGYPDPSNADILGFFGCSMTFGEGLDTPDNFPHVVSEHLGLDCLNLGLPGASARRVALTFAAALRIWPMRLAVVTLPSWTRTLYMDEQGYLKNLHLNYASKDKLREDYLRFVNDQHLLYESREAVESIMVNAHLHGVTVIMTSWESITYEMIRAITHTDPPLYQLWDSGSSRNPDDYARDNAHPGPRLTRRYALQLIRHIRNNNLLSTG